MGKTLTYIDLFSGCGGFAVGLERAGFELLLAVEKSNMAAETFCHNFISRINSKSEWTEYCKLSLAEQVRRKLAVTEVRSVLDDRSSVKFLRECEVDLLVGGPPCQGFSMAGRRNPSDARNRLPWEFIEMVEKVRPKAVVIENVVGIRQDFAKYNRESPFEKLRRVLETTEPGYSVQAVELNAKHFGVPQHRPRVMLLGLRKDVADTLGVSSGTAIWKSAEDHSSFTWRRPVLAPKATFDNGSMRTVRDALWDIDDKGYAIAQDDHRYVNPRGEYARLMRRDRSWIPACAPVGRTHELSNHNLRKHSEQTELRFRVYQYLQEQSLPLNVLNVPVRSSSEAKARREVEMVLAAAKVPAISPDGEILASNRGKLVDLVMNVGTRKHTQRPLKWNHVSPTVLSLPDDFVHPFQPRTLTVRELARIQSFPDSFEFRSKETTGSLRRRVEVPQYTQVGNAVPPMLSEALGKRFRKLLDSGVDRLSASARSNTSEDELATV